MENGSAHAPFAWHDFLLRMRHPSASDFVKSIKRWKIINGVIVGTCQRDEEMQFLFEYIQEKKICFIVSFSNKSPDPEKDSAAVQVFLANMEGAFRAHLLWAGCSEQDLESAGEGLEKYVITKLFNRVFAPLSEDIETDKELFEKIALLQQFIRPENLDIKPAFQNETSWLLAQKELQKINLFKAPRDKLMCILNCCKVINNLLLNASIASDDNPPGADDFLPVLIYVTIKANPPQLHSNLLYIQRYRRQSRLVSEVAYFFTNILSVESFIWNLDAQSLSMDEAEFQKKMVFARACLLGLTIHVESHGSQTKHDINQQTFDTSSETGLRTLIGEHYDSHPVHAEIKDLEHDQSITNEPSISTIEDRGATEILRDNQFSTHFQDYPYLYAHAGDLTVDDVHKLLDCYKRLVLMYVTQSQGIAVNTTTNATSTMAEGVVNTSKASEDGNRR